MRVQLPCDDQDKGEGQAATESSGFVDIPDDPFESNSETIRVPGGTECNWRGLLETDADDPLRVLVVDDEEVVASLIADAAESAGARAVKVLSGVEAVAKIKTSNFDLIFTDLLMPGMTGFELITIAGEVSPQTEIFVVTAYGTVDNAVECMKRGASGFIVKPDILDPVRNVVEDVGNRKRGSIKIVPLPVEDAVVGDQTRAAVAGVKDRKRLRQLAYMDHLTSLFNRQTFMHLLRREWIRSVRNGGTFGVLILAIDNFSEYREANGILASDLALIKIAEAIKRNIGGSDVPSHYGGDEFAIILPGVTRADASLLAKRICQSISSSNFEGVEELADGKLGLTVGLAMYPDDGRTVFDLIEMADGARDRISVRDRRGFRIADKPGTITNGKRSPGLFQETL